MTEPIQAEAIARAVLAELGGPLAVDELLSRLAAAGTLLSADDLEELRARGYLPLVWDLLDDRLADLRVLLAGRIFSHRVSTTEIECDLLAITPDLEPVALLADGPELLEIDGTATDVIEDGPGGGDGGALSVAAGRLAAARDGDLVGLRVESAGATLDLLVEPGPTPARLVEKLRRTVRDDDGEIKPVFWFDGIFQLCADDPEAFTSPLAPLGEIVKSAGLAIWGDYLAPAGFDVQAWLLSVDVDAFHAIYGLPLEVARAIAELGSEIRATAMHSQKFRNAEQHQKIVAAATTTVLAALHHPEVASALSVQALKGDAFSADHLASWADQQRTVALPRARPALLWLRGTAQRRTGEMLAAENSFQSVLDLDPRYRPALLDLADIESDRGERERAISLLRRADVADDDPMLVLLESLDRQTGPQLGRNDPCWCGSGRKFKQCHLNRPAEIPSADRARWLYFKATSFVRDATFQNLLLELAAIRAPEHNGSDDDALLEGLEDDPLAVDLALFEAGGLEQFLALRGELLPAADLELATSWIAISRSVYEIQDVGAGARVTLRDLRTGDSVEVKGNVEMTPMRPGRRLCARLLPAGAEFCAFGGVERVSEAGTDVLIEVLDGIDDALDERLEREIPDEMVELVAGMDPGELEQAVAEAARQMAAGGRFPDVDDVGRDWDDDDEHFGADDGDRSWAAIALMAALSIERSSAQ